MARPQKQKGIPGHAWWIGTTKYFICRALKERPDIITRLGFHQARFVNWCARVYTGLKPDLDECVTEFEKASINTRLENIDVGLLSKIRTGIFKRDNYTCQYCSKVGGELELDHIVPVSRGGLATEDNLTTACLKCNRQKHNKTPEEFIVWRLNHA